MNRFRPARVKGRKGLAAGGESENRVAPRGKFNSSPLAVWLQGSGEFFYFVHWRKKGTSCRDCCGIWFLPFLAKGSP